MFIVPIDAQVKVSLRHLVLRWLRRLIHINAVYSWRSTAYCRLPMR